MARLITKRLYDFDEFIEYNIENKNEITKNTFLRLSDHWLKYHKIMIIDIYNFKFTNDEEYESYKLSVYPNEWIMALECSLELFVKEEDYSSAITNRDVLEEIKQFFKEEIK